MKSGKSIIITETVGFNTDGEIDIINLTQEMEEFLRKSGVQEGQFHVFVNGSTGAIGATEFEPRLTIDNKKIFEKLIPKGAGYRHDEIDSNAHSHLRATLLGCEKTIPIANGQLLLGTWQQIVFFEFDVRKRRRTVIFQIIGIQ